MKIRRLQRKFEHNNWCDDAYAYEDNNGKVRFCYNLTWERMGSYYNQQLEQQAVSLEKIDSVIPSGPQLRWLPIEAIEDAEIGSYLAALDAVCAIVKPRASIKEPLRRPAPVSV